MVMIRGKERYRPLPIERGNNRAEQLTSCADSALCNRQDVRRSGLKRALPGSPMKRHHQEKTKTLEGAGAADQGRDDRCISAHCGRSVSPLDRLFPVRTKNSFASLRGPCAAIQLSSIDVSPGARRALDDAENGASYRDTAVPDLSQRACYLRIIHDRGDKHASTSAIYIPDTQWVRCDAA